MGSSASLPGHQDISDTLDLLESTFLRRDYKQRLKEIVPRDSIVLSHNDTIAGNILMSRHDNTNLMLIDYEVGMWNPEFYDLAGYLNEMSCNYSNPDQTCCIKYYHGNRPNIEEIEGLTKKYMSFKAKILQDYEKEDCGEQQRAHVCPGESDVRAAVD